MRPKPLMATLTLFAEVTCFVPRVPCTTGTLRLLEEEYLAMIQARKNGWHRKIPVTRQGGSSKISPCAVNLPSQAENQHERLGCPAPCSARPGRS